MSSLGTSVPGSAGTKRPKEQIRAPIGAWMPAGMLDWPGKVAPTIFLTGCQLRCAYCHNPSLLMTRTEARAWEQILAYIDRRRAWIDGVVISGGEPTNAEGLQDMLEVFADIGLPVKLDTNGMRPDVLSRLLRRGLLAHVALDVKTLPERYAALTDLPDAEERIRESIALLKRSAVSHEFRTTCYPGLVSIDELPRIAQSLTGGALYALQQFRSETTLHPEATLYRPHSSEALEAAADACRESIPTIVRGA